MRLRPLPLSELFDEVFRLYRRRFLLLWATSIFSAVPALVAVLAGVAIAAAFGVFSSTAGQFAGTPGTAELVAAGFGLLVALAMLPVAVYAPWRAAIATALGEPATAGRILQDVLRNYWRLWLLALGYGLLLLVCVLLLFTCLLIPLSAWLLVKWSLVIPAWFLERQRLGWALSRSWALTERNWWRLLGIMLLFYILYQVVSSALGSFTFLAVAAPHEWALAVTVIQLTVQVALSTLLTPLLPLVLTLLYLDLRVRHEHLDLEVMARQLAGPEPLWSLPSPPGAPPS